MNKEPISLSFSASDNYSQHLAVCIASFVANTPDRDFKVHILHQNITVENQEKIRELENLFANCRIVFHKVEMSMFEGFVVPRELEHITVEMYFRYLLPDLLTGEKRTLYSDVDVLAVDSIEPLWETDLKGNCLGAILDHKENTTGFQRYKMRLGMDAETPYFCSGFLLMDLDAIRGSGLVKKLFEKTLELSDSLAWPDQDVINLMFMDKILTLDETWSCTRKYSFFNRDVKIWHFQGFVQKPWCNIWKNLTWLPYLKYLLKSPYQSSAFKFVLGHLLGFFYFKYVKKGVERTLVCGILVRKRKVQ